MIFTKEVKIYSLRNTALKGRMPVEELVEKAEAFYGERNARYTRQYLADGVDQRIDKVIRIWRDDSISNHDYAILDGNIEEQYRISDVNAHLDEDGLEIMDLSLYRLEQNYSLALAETEGTGG